MDEGSPAPALGKVSREVFDRVILPRLGRRRDAVRVGPRHGVDVGVVDLGGGQVLVSTMDPLFVMPAYGWRRAAWFALHIVASDAATSGIAPQYITVDLNLPPDMGDADFTEFWEAFHAACDEVGVAVITGHTGRYDGCCFPMIGAATVLGVGPADRYVTPAMAQAGDVILVTKGVAIETVGQLGVLRRAEIAALLGESAAREAEALFDQMTVVRDALTAASVGVRDAGVRAMHDATEFGLWGALVEVADASGLGLCVEQEAVPMPPVVRALAARCGFDPFVASSEGTLVMTCAPRHQAEIIDQLERVGILAAAVGELVPREQGLAVWHGGRSRALAYPDSDPFWELLHRPHLDRSLNTAP